MPNTENDRKVALMKALASLKTALCHGCKILHIPKGGIGVCHNFCKHWYCLTCYKLKKIVYQALKSAHSLK